MEDAKRRIAALEMWRVYRRWAVASAAMKRRSDLWRRVVLWLTIAALVLGPLATSEPPLGPGWLARAIAVASGAAVALGAYLSDKVLGTDRDVGWVRARQAAEGLKSLTFAFLMGAAPFEVTKDVETLDAERKRIEEAGPLSSLVALPISPEEGEKGFPSYPLTIDSYVTTRAQDQHRWFETKVVQCHKEVARLDMATKILGGIAAVLAIVVAYWARLGIWVGVMTSLSAALATQVTGGRSRFLEKSYHDTAARLARIVSRWETSNGAPADAKRLVEDCELALREENAGWVQAMLKTQGGARVAASDQVSAPAERAAPAPGTP